MADLNFILLILGVFFFAGTIKGVVGLGLPTVSLAMLALFIDVKAAIVLLLVPSLVTNIWQAVVGGEFLTIIKRLWTLLVPAALFIFVGVHFLADADADAIRAILGVLLFAYATISLLAPQIPAPGRFEKSLSPVMGIMSGLCTGLTGTFVVPGLLYLQALRLPRDMLIQALGITFTWSNTCLMIALGFQGMLSLNLGTLSAVGVIPALVGMAFGQRVRKGIPEETFRKILFGALALLGAWLMIRGIL